ncbi:MAG: MarR family transcriptional regulator [Candidatus Synoicihabitans palmerolidicus]|nr:MarR family transcriptional regulator [Candidatus Synoicihabitans palmerolidicus]
MSTSFRLAIAGEPLLALAASAGPSHPAACMALLNLLVTSETLGETLRCVLGRQHLSPIGLSILTQLAANSDRALGTSELSAAVDRTPQAVSEALARLVLSDFIRRSRDPKNRRHHLIELPPLAALPSKAP